MNGLNFITLLFFLAVGIITSLVVNGLYLLYKSDPGDHPSIGCLDVGGTYIERRGCYMKDDQGRLSPLKFCTETK